MAQFSVLANIGQRYKRSSLAFYPGNSCSFFPTNFQEKQNFQNSDSSNKLVGTISDVGFSDKSEILLRKTPIFFSGKILKFGENPDTRFSKMPIKLLGKAPLYFRRNLQSVLK